jgi:L-seryl-tRNA(Ser) seleniumtransferase
MNRIRTRRDFFQWSRGLLAAGGLAGQALPLRSAPAPNDPAEDGEDYYDKLGVTKIINAAGTYTILTASTMPPSVQAAVARAAKHPVRLIQLQKAAGEYLAGKLHCEAAMVTAGAASALTLGTAACMTVANQSASHAIPTDMAGLKNEVIVQKAHRYGYDHALRNCGIRFVEVETPAEYDAAFTGQTVMAHFFNAAEAGQIGREEWIRVAHKHGVPCFNDAAADVPPISNLWNYTRMGFDLVTFSGGKGIRGPQNAGLLLGRKDLIAAAVANNSPFDDCVGRGMKVAKEQIVGMVAAVDWVLSHTEESMQGDYQKRVDLIVAAVKGIPSVTTETVVPRIANHVPHLLIRFDPSVTGCSTAEILTRLREGKPSIELNPNTGKPPNQGIPSNANTLVVGVWMLQPGEDAIVGHRIREALTSKA